MGGPRSFRRAFSAALFASLPTDGLNGFIIARVARQREGQLRARFIQRPPLPSRRLLCAFFWSASFFLRNLSAFSAFWAAASASAFSSACVEQRRVDGVASTASGRRENGTPRHAPCASAAAACPVSRSPWLPNERPALLVSTLSNPSCPPRPSPLRGRESRASTSHLQLQSVRRLRIVISRRITITPRVAAHRAVCRPSSSVSDDDWAL